ncbi:MAG: nucleotide exchange factor GrpE [Oscillospiraceae bacterium]|nr:nucleotide exchange factor GrpE [Oscillospiraceae bacterium]
MSKKKKEEPDEVVEEAAISPEQAEIATLEEALSAEKDSRLRLAAEYDNYRKRSQKEREGLYTDVKANVITELLPVYDNLERALKQETADEAFYKGVEMTMTQLGEIFEKLHVTKIPAVGEKFDPEKHEAVFHIEDEAYGESEIVEQFLTGFQLGEKVIRHSIVKVAN